MICCVECFRDSEIRAAIKMIGHKGKCPICNRQDVWIYDSEKDLFLSNVEELLDSILEIYIPESELPELYPEDEKMNIEERLLKDWEIFSGNTYEVKNIVTEIIDESFDLDSRLISEKIGVPQLYDEEYLRDNSILGVGNWDTFKKYIRNENRFHGEYINYEILENILKETEIIIPKDEYFYRARLTDERHKNGFEKGEMGAPPCDVASAGRINSKGQSCLYLSNNMDTTVKEIRGQAFDGVTIATFNTKCELHVLDLSSIAHFTPFYKDNNKINYLINERHLRRIKNDLAKPVSRLDSDLDYLPTQYISDFAKYLGYDGVKYYSTFDKESYNLALFNPNACECVECENYIINNLDYHLIRN